MKFRIQLRYRRLQICANSCGPLVGFLSDSLYLKKAGSGVYCYRSFCEPQGGACDLARMLREVRYEKDILLFMGGDDVWF
jgi:hypothetical protein